jgi:hypothetical protein
MGNTQRLGTIPLAIQTDASNNVGIGAAPSGSYKLEVTGTAKVSSTLLLGGALTGTSATFSSSVTSSLNGFNACGAYGLKSYEGSSPSGKNIQFTLAIFNSIDGIYQSSGNTNDFGIWTNGGTSSQPKLYIKNAGNVGIGASDPAKKLDVYSTATTNTAQLVVSDASSTNRLYLGTFSNGSYISFGGTYQSGWSANGTNAIANIGMSATSGASTIQFETSSTNGAGPTERMRITSAGIVEFSVFTRSLLYQIYQGGTFRGGLYNYVSASGAGSDYSPTLVSETSLYFCTNGDAVKRMTISTTGAVTIANLGTGAVTATSGVLSTTSDMNLKIEDGFIDNALEKVLNLKPRYFLWKEESGLPTDLRQLGFYAQEVNAALGEEVANTPKTENDSWGIYDRGIIAMLTKAIQELNERLNKAGL